MDLNPSGKFCPICKHKNPHTATVCSYCGALLEENLTNRVATTKNTGGQINILTENVGSFIDIALIPEGGIGIYIEGAPKPYYLQMDKELIIGRKPEAALETFLDLAGIDAFNLGISRRHAMIRRKEYGYEISDLASTNGTWLNNERLVPNKPYPLTSGSQVSVGRMRFFVLYRLGLETTKK